MGNSTNQNRWKDTVPDQLKPVGNGDSDLNLKEMLRDKSVIIGLVSAVLGIILAFLCFKFLTGNLRTILGFLAAALAFTGTGQITKYINNKTVNGVQNQSKTSK